VSISHEQQHWIVGNKFATNKEARLTDFGLNSRGAEVHLFISKGEIGDSPSDADHVTLNDPQLQPWSPNRPYDQYNVVQSQRQWGGGPHVPEYSQPTLYASNNQFYGGPGGHQFGAAGGQRPRGNNFIPEGMAIPPRFPSPPPPPPPGWTCSFCAAFNEPLRPGCKLCSTGRPADYKPPPDYQPTKEELKWIQDEKLGIQGLEEVCVSVVIIHYNTRKFLSENC